MFPPVGTLRSADLRRGKDLEASVVCSLSIEATPCSEISTTAEGAAQALLRVGIRTSLAVFHLPQDSFEALLIESLRLSAAVFPILNRGAPDP